MSEQQLLRLQHLLPFLEKMSLARKMFPIRRWKNSHTLEPRGRERAGRRRCGADGAAEPRARQPALCARIRAPRATRSRHARITKGRRASAVHVCSQWTPPPPDWGLGRIVTLRDHGHKSSLLVENPASRGKISRGLQLSSPGTGCVHAVEEHATAVQSAVQTNKKLAVAPSARVRMGGAHTRGNRIPEKTRLCFQNPQAKMGVKDIIKKDIPGSCAAAPPHTQRLAHGASFCAPIAGEAAESRITAKGALAPARIHGNAFPG